MMNRRIWFAATLASLPLLAVGVAYANTRQAATFVCPVTGETLPCEKCCPLSSGESFTCPQTGEELPCPKCCPLNK